MDSTTEYRSAEERMFTELLLREQEDVRFLSSAMSMDNSCKYDIQVDVPSIISLGKHELEIFQFQPKRVFFIASLIFAIENVPGCIPAAPQGSNIDCGLVRSKVDVTAPQSLQPNESDLRRNVTEALRVAIDGDSFEGFFPDECLLNQPSNRRLF